MIKERAEDCLAVSADVEKIIVSNVVSTNCLWKCCLQICANARTVADELGTQSLSQTLSQTVDQAIIALFSSRSARHASARGIRKTINPKSTGNLFDNSLQHMGRGPARSCFSVLVIFTLFPIKRAQAIG